MSDHHPTLSPSAFPKLNLCIEYKPQPIAGPAAQRGSGLHEQIEQHHTKGTPINDAGAASAYARAKEFISDIRGVESRLSYLDDGLNEITFGTADMWGYHGVGEDRTLVLVDYKSGRLEDPNSYFEQMAVYALMLMDREGETSAVSVIVGIDTGEDHIHSWNYEPTKQLVDGIIYRVNAKNEPPSENKYCQWCSKRINCSVWLPDAQAALTVMPSMPATLTREWILSSPENAGRFLTAYKKLQAIVEKDMDVAGFVKESILAGHPVDGWKIQTRKGAERLDTKEVKRRWAELTDEVIPSSVGQDTISLVEAK